MVVEGAGADPQEPGDGGDGVLGVGQQVAGGPDDLGRGHDGPPAGAAALAGGCQALAGAGDDELADELRERGEDVEHQPPAGGGGVQGLVQRGERDLAAAQVPHGGDQVLQRAGEPVQGGHHESVPGLHELQRGAQLGPVSVPAGLLVGEDPPAPGRGERVDLPVELLPARGHPRVADPDAGQLSRLGAGRHRRSGGVLDRLRRALVARGPVQESIARGLGAHAAEQARAAAEQSAAQAAEDARRQQIAQAKADLREIVNDALSDLRAVEPDATSEERDTTRSSFVATPSSSLTAGGVRLRIDLWEGMTTSQPVQGDTMVLAGCVMITNPSYDTELNSANLVYEQVDDRLAWQIYKFRSGIVPPDKYPYGPYGRTHGLRHGEFFDPRERSFMLRPVMHVWSKTVTTLTAETLLELFQEAVNLRPPDPRTGIW